MGEERRKMSVVKTQLELRIEEERAMRQSAEKRCEDIRAHFDGDGGKAGGEREDALAQLSSLLDAARKEVRNFVRKEQFPSTTYHISLEQNLTIKSHDGGKEGHFCDCGDTSIHLPLTRSAQPSG